MKTAALAARLETPVVSGFRNEMKSCALIGRKLGTMFEVPKDNHAAIEGLLRELDRRFPR